eukprot:6457617-Amphidinium_carterae.1
MGVVAEEERSQHGALRDPKSNVLSSRSIGIKSHCSSALAQHTPNKPNLHQVSSMVKQDARKLRDLDFVKCGSEVELKHSKAVAFTHA